MTTVGTPLYAAPELSLGYRYDAKVFEKLCWILKSFEVLVALGCF